MRSEKEGMPVSAERKKVLELLAAGKITAEDAERLLDKLAGIVPEQTDTKDEGNQAPPPGARKPRYLRILIERPGQEHVNVRVPLAFTRTGSRLLAVLPPRVAERLSEYGIDISSLTALGEEEFAKAMDEMNVEIERGNGKKVRIFCE